MKANENIQNKSRAELASLVSRLEEKLVREIQVRDNHILILEEELRLSRLRQFARKSEKLPDGVEQFAFTFDEPVQPENATELEQAEEDITVPEHTRRKSGRKPLPKDLPREVHRHDLPEHERTCVCGCALTEIGVEKSEQFEIIPAQVKVIVHERLKYACTACEDTIITAPAPGMPIPKSIATPATLSYVATSKYKDHLPLYRQEIILQRMGIDIPRNTLANWMIKTGQLLHVLYKLLVANLSEYDIAYADETRVQVLKEPGREPTQISFMWCFIGGPEDKRSIIYHYDPGRSHQVIVEVLEEFKGRLHCDGYPGYDTFAKGRDIVLVGCWMHVRRKFIEITKTVKTSGLAHRVVQLIAILYKIEKNIKSAPPEERQAVRSKQSGPVLSKIKALMDDSVTKVPPKSALGKAISYTLHQWSKLCVFLEDGRLEIDNGRSERAIKPFVISRKNWLFSDSVAGVRSGQVIYSLIETCQAHGLEPYAYLRYVLTHIPNAKTQEELEALLPYNLNTEQLRLM